MLRLRAYSKLLLLSVLAIAPLSASRLNPVSWQIDADPASSAPGSTVLLHLRATIDSGYHLYSFTTPAGGPIRTTASVPLDATVEAFTIYQPQPNRHTDPTLGVPVETFDHLADFPLLLRLRKSAPLAPSIVNASIRYQACSDEICLPPVTRMVPVQLAVGGGQNVNASVPDGYRLAGGSLPQQASRPSMPMAVDLRLILAAFGFGLLALLTPCVFPTIPLTITYLVGAEQSSSRAALRRAALFCLGIVALFSLLGLGVTALAGPFSIIQLASSPWVNGFVALVFLAMGSSLLGAFELVLPSALLTKADSASRGSGILPGLLLGLTFCLTSFSCVGPFLGALLAASAKSGGWAPVLGTVSFALGLATPFFLLASFPSFLKKLPRSGAWLEHTRVVLGIVVIALAFKYLGSVDSVLHWSLFTRERILAVWVALAVALSLYLLGQLRLSAPSSSASTRVSTGRVLAGVAVLAFAISLVPGLLGVNLGFWEAYLPLDGAGSAQASSLSTSAPAHWIENNYESAIARARSEKKPLLIAFSGYTCTNCHWMKANIFARPDVQNELQKYVLLELYTDGVDPASQRNQALEQDRFQTVALPYYVVVDAAGRELAHRDGITRRPGDFISFLKQAKSDSQAA